jgi:uroporphyrin-III C-methyltransferase/precorrin-2 dehydrogenase/sirohydrochlorin ferrochelatase/uroporphyrin-III C-methyltransferase
MRALSKQLTQKWPDALWRLAQRAWAPLSRDNAPRLRLPLSGACQPGTVYLVGAGSGDVELLTLKAARLLMQADAVVYDRLVGDDVLGLVPPGTERYYVGKASGHHSMPQAEIGALIVSLAQAGKSVVRLKGGDPGVFGRMGEELAALAEAGLPAEIVPGITAASAAAAGMGICLLYTSTLPTTPYV